MAPWIGDTLHQLARIQRELSGNDFTAASGRYRGHRGW